jgi:hypothetical protein
MARKHYAHRTPPRAIRSSGEEVQEGDLDQVLVQGRQPSAIHEFHAEHGDGVSEGAMDEHQDHQLDEADFDGATPYVRDPKERRTDIASLLGIRTKMSPSEWAVKKSELEQIEDPEQQHEVDLLLDEVDTTFQTRHDHMTDRIEQLQGGGDVTEEQRESSTKRAAFEGVRPLREQRFESDLWLDRVKIDQLDARDNDLQIRGREESEEIDVEVEDLLVLHESGDVMLSEVRAEYRQLRQRQADASEVARREPFTQDRGTMEVRDDYTPGERHPEESSDPRRIMKVVHTFNSTLAELLPLLEVEKERLPAALVEASEHLMKLVEIADAVLLYSGVPVFDEVPRQLMISLVQGMESAGRARVQQGELVERSDLGGWEAMAVDDGTGKSPSAFEVLLGIDEHEARDRISLFSLQVLQACGTGPTEALEFRDLDFPE